MAILIGGYTFGGVGLTLVLIGLLQILVLCAGAFAAVELDRRRRRSDAQLRRTIDKVAATPHLLALRELVGVQERRIGEAVDAAERASVGVEAVGTHLQEEVARASRDLGAKLEVGRRDLRLQFAQIDSLIALYYEIRPERALPITGGWAASADLLLWCWRHVLERRPAMIVECGSGASTVVLASACRRNGHGRVFALDHDEHFAGKTRAMLEEHGLAAFAEVRTAPLELLDGQDQRWYRLDQVPEGAVDLLFIDGPPQDSGDLARLPAMDVLYPQLVADAVVALDDANRPGEQAIVERWLETYPQLELEQLQHQKGTAILRRRS